MIIKNWNIENLTGYKPITTFYTDFSIADNFGVKAIKETFNRAFKEWKSDYKYITELTMVMSWKSFEHQNNYEYSKLYSELYYELDKWVNENLKDNELEYYYRTTD